jgi:hypothetical protein
MHYKTITVQCLHTENLITLTEIIKVGIRSVLWEIKKLSPTTLTETTE